MNSILIFVGLISLAFSATIPRPQLKESAMCYACPILIEMIEKLVADDPSLLTTLETDADAFCEKLPIPASYKVYCLNFTEAALPDLINALEKDLPPSKVCADALHCTTSDVNSIRLTKLTKPIARLPLVKLNKASYGKIQMVKLNKPKAAVGGIECEGCESLLKMIDAQLSDANFQKEILSDILKVCSSVPVQYQTQCTSLVNQYGNELLQEAAKELNPTTACAALNLCSAKTKFNVFMSLVGAQSAVDALCGSCKYAAQEATTYLKQYLPQLTQQLNGICAVLPSDLQGSCTSFIAQYGQKIANDIINNPNLPTEACTYAGLCSSTVAMSYKMCKGNRNCNVAYNKDATRNNLVAKVVFNRPQNKEAILCEMCDIFFGYLATELNSTSIQNDITDAVDIACAVFPNNMQPDCEQLVGTYIPIALTDAANALNPNVLCKSLKACP